jgi:hypothetical protein
MDKNNKSLNIILILLATVTVVFNIVMFFFLPDSVATKISFEGKAVQYMNTTLYLILSAGLIALSAATGIFLADKKTKYIVVTAILFAANIAVSVVNL